MSESTIARLKGDKSGFVHPKLIEDYINSNPDKFFGYKAEVRGIKREDWGEISELKEGYHNYSDSSETKQYNISGWITLSLNGNEKRSMFYSYNNIRYQDDVLNVVGEGKVITNYTWLSLGCDHWAQNVMIELLSYFGGWYEADDCAEDTRLIPYKETSEGDYKPPRFVTLQDVYDKFGEYVIIQGVF